MPHSTYLPDMMGTAVIEPAGEFEAGSYASLTLTYTAGPFGIDDTGCLKISWRTMSDMGKPQFDDPQGPNYTTVEASNGASLDHRIDRVNIRPWANTLFIRVMRGFLRAGETITVRFGDMRQGSPGIRLQTNVEPSFEFKTFVDAFATYDFVELPVSPTISLVPGRLTRWKLILPTLRRSGEPFRLAIVAEDRWGNPTDKAKMTVAVCPNWPVDGLPERLSVGPGDGPLVIDGLMVDAEGDLFIDLFDAAGQLLARSNPLRLKAETPFLHYWGDLHGQSEETIGTNAAADYFDFARNKAFIDIVGHQGNDFQITPEFWTELNRLYRRHNEPGVFVTVPGYEWSGNTGMGGDRNVFFMDEDHAIRRSSSVLVPGHTTGEADVYTADALFSALQGEDAVVIAHVGGRYADLSTAHDGRLERAVEVHSAWGTFEWLLHDAFDLGYRVGVVCHSDDHKGRPGATRPGASSFGAIGGLTCYLMPELDRRTVFATLRGRRHYGTTGTRLYLDVRAHFDEEAKLFSDDPALGETAASPVFEALMGDIVRTEGRTTRLKVEATASAPIERVVLFNGSKPIATERPYGPEEMGRRIRVLWEGAEYRGRGREVFWTGGATLTGNRFIRAEAVNFLNADKPLNAKSGASLSWESVTTGNYAGFDIWLEDGEAGELAIRTNILSHSFAIAEIGMEDIIVDAGGLGRRLRVFRLPDENPYYSFSLERDVELTPGADNPLYVRLTQEDGHQAWSSPIYLIP
jgi:hypothetical protein